MISDPSPCAPDIYLNKFVFALLDCLIACVIVLVAIVDPRLCVEIDKIHVVRYQGVYHRLRIVEHPVLKTKHCLIQYRKHILFECRVAVLKTCGGRRVVADHRRQGTENIIERPVNGIIELL